MAWNETDHGSASTATSSRHGVGHREGHGRVGRHAARRTRRWPRPRCRCGCRGTGGPPRSASRWSSHRARRPGTPATMPRARHPMLRVQHAPAGPARGPSTAGPSVVDGAHHLVAEHLGERDERRHHVVAGVLEVHEDLLGVGPADAGDAVPEDQPVVRDERRVGQVHQGHRRGGQVLQQDRVVAGRRGSGHGSGIGQELRAPSWWLSFMSGVVRCRSPALATMPATNPSRSVVLYSTTALRSGT